MSPSVLGVNTALLGTVGLTAILTSYSFRLTTSQKPDEQEEQTVWIVWEGEQPGREMSSEGAGGARLSERPPWQK